MPEESGLRLIVFTNLYPGPDMPRHGIFVKERLRQLMTLPDVDIHVIALRPRNILKTGFRSSLIAKEGRSEGSPSVEYVTVPTLPKISNWIDPWLWARAARSFVQGSVRAPAGATIIDAHFLYPDGVAAVLIGRELGIPTVLTARGSDVNVKCKDFVVRSWLRWAAPESAGIITVSSALADLVKHHGFDPPVLEVFRNGVDLAKFRPVDNDSPKTALGVTGKLIATVGHLTEDKGHHLAIKALALLPEYSLVVIGEGPDERKLERLAAKHRVGDRVRFLGQIAHDELATYYSAADALVLASRREGMPNVILESIACGTPVIATAVGGVPELLREGETGFLMSDRSASSVAEAVRKLESSGIDRAKVRRCGAQLGWAPVVSRQMAFYRQILADHETAVVAQ